jgi:hypothetical protein
MEMTAHERGYFSVVRWRSDPTRDEARNVAIVLVDAEGQFGGIRIAPPSALSGDARQQGFLDAMLHGLENQFEGEEKPDLKRLRELSESLSNSLYLTAPRATAVPDPELTLQALYRAYVAPIPAPRAVTKGVVIDKVVKILRGRGFSVNRSQYIGDFLFDAVVERKEGPLACDVLSFATAKQDWLPTERDAGHFLYGLERVKLPGIAVIQPPAEESRGEAQTSFERVRRWFKDAAVPVRQPDDLVDSQLSLSVH